MVAYDFKPCFAALVRTGAKLQTIRKPRKRHAVPGEAVQLYTGMRTPDCDLLAEGTCVGASPITLRFISNEITVEPHSPHAFEEPIPVPFTLDEFAKRDGFDDWSAMKAWFLETYDGAPLFEGVLIRWRLNDGNE